MPKKPKIAALIPARSGSKRIKNKNIRKLNGIPLIAYSIQAARESGLFERVIVSTDSPQIAGIAINFGAEVPFLRPSKFAHDTSPDIEWLSHLLGDIGELPEYFAILRPTSPFRTSGTILRAWTEFLKVPSAESIRAVEKCLQHPAKMWRLSGNFLQPLMENPDKKAIPWHSTPYQKLPEIHAQNASLEIAKVEVVTEKGSISGDRILAFKTQGFEGYDINCEKDWIYAEHLIKIGKVKLPKIKKQKKL